MVCMDVTLTALSLSPPTSLTPSLSTSYILQSVAVFALDGGVFEGESLMVGEPQANTQPVHDSKSE